MPDEIGDTVILGDVGILGAIERGEVVVRPPPRPEAVGSNSIDLHLGPHLAVYSGRVLRTDREMPVLRSRIHDEEGALLLPGELYLAATVEWVSCGPYAPMLEGTSGAGRLGISVHATAGVGDVGFEGHWTLEITVVRPVLVFGGEPVAQMVLHTVGPVRTPYRERAGACYADARGATCPCGGSEGRFLLGCSVCDGTGLVPDPRPQPSRMWRKGRAPT
jgi:dCTP deaminase